MSASVVEGQELVSDGGHPEALQVLTPLVPRPHTARILPARILCPRPRLLCPRPRA